MGFLTICNGVTTFVSTEVDKTSEKLIEMTNRTLKIILENLNKSAMYGGRDDIKGVGHRVLHGGEKYSDSVLIDEEVIQSIKFYARYQELKLVYERLTSEEVSYYKVISIIKNEMQKIEDCSK